MPVAFFSAPSFGLSANLEVRRKWTMEVRFNSFCFEIPGANESGMGCGAMAVSNGMLIPKWKVGCMRSEAWCGWISATCFCFYIWGLGPLRIHNVVTSWNISLWSTYDAYDSWLMTEYDSTTLILTFLFNMELPWCKAGVNVATWSLAAYHHATGLSPTAPKRWFQRWVHMSHHWEFARGRWVLGSTAKNLRKWWTLLDVHPRLGKDVWQIPVSQLDIKWQNLEPLEPQLILMGSWSLEIQNFRKGTGVRMGRDVDVLEIWILLGIFFTKVVSPWRESHPRPRWPSWWWGWCQWGCRGFFWDAASNGSLKRASFNQGIGNTPGPRSFLDLSGLVCHPFGYQRFCGHK